MSCEVEFTPNQQTVEIKKEKEELVKLPLYLSTETVKGVARVKLNNPGKKVEHHGITIELLGQIGWLIINKSEDFSFIKTHYFLLFRYFLRNVL